VSSHASGRAFGIGIAGLGVVALLVGWAAEQWLHIARFRVAKVLYLVCLALAPRHVSSAYVMVHHVTLIAPVGLECAGAVLTGLGLRHAARGQWIGKSANGTVFKF
jgi:hypothetical protein